MIHAGEDCCAQNKDKYADASCQGGHYYKGTAPTCGVTPDPWKPFYGAIWVSSADGVASADMVNPSKATATDEPDVTGGPFVASTNDPDHCGVKGRVVIVHDKDHKRIGCGKLVE